MEKMNKLLISLLSMMFFMSVLSYAEAEEECDQAIIDEGVILREAYVKARRALPEYEANDKAWRAYSKAQEALPEYEADNIKSWRAYIKARNVLPEYEAYNKARRAFYKARDALPEYETLNVFLDANSRCERKILDDYDERTSSLSRSRSSRPPHSETTQKSNKGSGKRGVQ